jgi:hypothetical protein
MDWKKILSLIDNNDENQNNDYILITRDNVNILKPGMHIKYIKKYYDEGTKRVKEKMCNGGFLINIINSDKIVNMILVLKTNIYWNMRFLKYTIYAKKIEKVNNVNIILNNHVNNTELQDRLEKERHELKKNMDNYAIAKRKERKITFRDDD